MPDFATLDRKKLSEDEVRARRELVLRNLCELMKSVASGKQFQAPETWLDDLVERPTHRQSLLQE